MSATIWPVVPVTTVSVKLPVASVVADGLARVLDAVAVGVDEDGRARVVAGGQLRVAGGVGRERGRDDLAGVGEVVTGGVVLRRRCRRRRRRARRPG